MAKRGSQVPSDVDHGDTPGRKISRTPEEVLETSEEIDASHLVTPNEEYDDSNSSGIQAEASGPSPGRIAIMRNLGGPERYKMSHRKRGTCLVFNQEVFKNPNYNRPGSQIDAERIRHTFEQLNFEVIICEDFTYEKITKEIEKLRVEDHTNNDCLCVFVLSHGRSQDLLQARDAWFESHDIWKPFTADQCPTLAGKPKLFFFQACRGERSDKGVKIQSNEQTNDQMDTIAYYKIPTLTDFLIAHSCVEGFPSWRNTVEGTWYVQSLCSVLDEFSTTTDLMRMLTMTAWIVADFQSNYPQIPAKHAQKQIPSITSTLVKDLYFTPK